MMQIDVSTQQVASTMAMVVLPQSVWEDVKSDIQDMKELLTKRNTKNTENKWIDSVKARKMLGVSPKTWQTYRDKRIIPFAQIGRKILVKREDLQAFMESHYISTKE